MNVRMAALGALSLLAASACSTGDASSSEPMSEGSAAYPVEVARPLTTDLSATYEATATLAADAETGVVARVSGEVVAIAVEEGAPVAAGQILARLDGHRLRLRMNQAKANLDRVTREYERLRPLHERGLVSAAAFDALGLEREALEAAYELHRLNHGYATIRAPIAGVVSSRDVKPGTHVEVGAPLFRITDTTNLIAYLHIPQSELATLEAADTAVVRADAIPGGRFTARIVRISPTIDPRTGAFRATARIDNAGGLLAPGMFSRFSIEHDTRAAALVIPSDAILREDNDSVVYVVEDGVAARRQVTTGIESDGVTEILHGLSAEDHVIVTGHKSLRDGSNVLAHQWPSGNVSG